MKQTFTEVGKCNKIFKSLRKLCKKAKSLINNPKPKHVQSTETEEKKSCVQSEVKQTIQACVSWYPLLLSALRVNISEYLHRSREEFQEPLGLNILHLQTSSACLNVFCLLVWTGMICTTFEQRQAAPLGLASCPGCLEVTTGLGWHRVIFWPSVSHLLHSPSKSSLSRVSWRQETCGLDDILHTISLSPKGICVYQGGLPQRLEKKRDFSHNRFMNTGYLRECLSQIHYFFIRLFKEHPRKIEDLITISSCYQQLLFIFQWEQL